jgi:hypothetical protein
MEKYVVILSNRVLTKEFPDTALEQKILRKLLALATNTLNATRMHSSARSTALKRS